MKSTVKLSVAAILGMGAFASCATIVRLRYLSLYSDPAEFMFATGKVSLWSIIEEGIGICAGSLPALRPLLSLPIISRGGSSATPSNPLTASKFKQSRSRPILRSDVCLDTFVKIGDKEGGDGDGDGDNQKNILKQTQYTVTSNRRSNPLGQWQNSHVLG